jgi:hypothetical protein
LKLLEHKLCYNTVYDFLEAMLCNSMLSNSINCEQIQIDNLNQNCFSLLSSFISDNKILEYSPYVIATAVIAIERDMNKMRDSWPNGIENSGNGNENLKEVINIIKRYAYIK